MPKMSVSYRVMNVVSMLMISEELNDLESD